MRMRISGLKCVEKIFICAIFVFHFFTFSFFALAGEINEASSLSITEKKWIAEHPVVTASNNTGYAPIDFVSAGVPAGLSIDYLNLIASKVGLKIEYINFGSWSLMLENAKNQEVDIIQTLSRTEERENYFNFSDPYFKVPIAIYGHSGAQRINGVNDLKGKNIGIIKNHIVGASYQQKYPELNYITYSNNREVLMALSSGEIDVYPGDVTAIDFTLSQDNIKDIEIIGDDLVMQDNDIEQRIAVHKNNPILIDIIKKGMALVTDEEFREISNKWIKPAISDYNVGLTQQEKNWLSNHKTILVAAEKKTFPYEFIDKNGNISGISGDFLDEIAQRLNVTFKWAGNDNWHSGLESFKAHQIDMIAVVTPTKEREEYIIFTEPYMKFEQAIFTVKNNQVFTSLESLVGHKISLSKDAALVEFIKKDYPDIKIIEAEDDQKALNMVLVGQTDAYIGDIPFVNSLMPIIGTSNLIVTGISPYKMESAMGIQADLPLLASSIKKALADIDPLSRQKIFNKWYSVNIEPTTNYGALLYVLGFSIFISVVILIWNYSMRREISLRRKIEEKLNLEIKSKELIAEQLDSDMERFHGAFKNIATGAIVADSKGTIEVFNEAAEKIFGYKSDEVVGKNVKMLMPEFHATRHDKYIENYITSGVRKIIGIGIKVKALRKNGEEVPIHLGVGEMKIKDKVSFIGSITDLTDITQAQYALEQALHDATKANRAKSTFLAETSHELRTPLNAILGFSEMLLNKYFGELNEKQLDYVKDINRSGKHLLDLINTLLDLTEIESGKKDINKEILSAKEIVEECTEIMRYQIMQKNITLNFSMDKDQPEIYADRLALKQVLFNLLTNSIKYTQNEGEITISVEQQQDMKKIMVKDNGQGIEEELIENLTEPFFKGKKSAYYAEEGWGLGLAITKLLIEAHGGRLKIESALGKGTSVMFFLPDLIENACIISKKSGRHFPSTTTLQ
ncbi:MAG: transporter substrate-binding domain-containing protein [Emcibacteraceae bacterium]